MNSIYYFAAWTDSGFLLGCDHEHETVPEAVACISCGGGYVIAVENNVLRALTDEEEAALRQLRGSGSEFERRPEDCALWLGRMDGHAERTLTRTSISLGHNVHHFAAFTKPHARW
jgi:hypothetical protein